MTYLEAYQQCKTFEELKERVRKDISVAKWLNQDRIKPINDAAIQVCKERGWYDREVKGATQERRMDFL